MLPLPKWPPPPANGWLPIARERVAPVCRERVAHHSTRDDSLCRQAVGQGVQHVLVKCAAGALSARPHAGR